MQTILRKVEVIQLNSNINSFGKWTVVMLDNYTLRKLLCSNLRGYISSN